MSSQKTLKRMAFQKQIRRNQILTVFEKRRSQMMNRFDIKDSYNANDPAAQLTTLYNSLVQAREKQKYEQFITLKKQKYSVEWFHQFLSNDVNDSLLTMATSILGDYYYYADRKLPAIVTLRYLIECFKAAENEVLSNCMLIIQNILHDYKELKETFVNTFDFVDVIVQKLEKHHEDKELLKKLLKIVYHLLNLSKPCNSYEKLLMPMLTLINFPAEQSTREIHLTAIYNFHMLAKLFLNTIPLHSYIVENKIIQQLIGLLQLPEYAQRRFVFIIFDLIQICKLHFNQNHVKQVIMPLILGLRTLKFEYGTRSSVYTAQTIKIKAYRYILYLTEHALPLAHQMFAYGNYQLMKMFFKELQDEESPKVAEVLAKTVCHLSVCFPQQIRAIKFLQRQVNRTIQINDYRYEIEKYFEPYLLEFGNYIDIEL